MSVIKMTDLDLKGKRVFIRADLNVPVKDGKVTSDARIRATIPTLKLALEKGAKVMVTSHLGRPTEGEFKPEDSLQPVVDYLKDAGFNVRLVQDYLNGVDVKEGEIVVLENVRVNKGEKKNDPELGKKYAALCDVFVMDAFGTAHRAQASTYGVAEFAPVACAGPLLAAELDALGKALKEPARPMVAIVGGSKVSTKLEVLNSLSKIADQIIVGGGIAGIQAAITAADRGHKVTLAEKSDKLGGLLYFTDVDIDKPDLRNFKDMMIREVKRHDVEILMNTEVTPEFIKEFAPDAVILATGSVPACPPINGIEHAHQAMSVYDGTCEPGKKVVMIGGGLVGCETGLYLQKTGHEVTVVEMLDRVANESFGMYREALVWEMEKNNMTMLPKTKCLEITPNSVKIENADGVQELEADTILYALGMKSVDYSALKEAAGDASVYVIGDAIHPGKVDQCTRTGYIAALKVGASEESVAYIQE